MAKKGFVQVGKEGEMSLGSETWNVADGYTKLKILKILIQLDRYDIIAQFGTEEIDQDLFMNLDENSINKRRVEALLRFTSSLKLLIGNVKFALGKDKSDLINSFKERIDNVNEVIENVAETYKNQVSKTFTLKINEKLFKKCLTVLQNVKDDLNFPINDAGLIFRQSEEFDLDKIQREIEQGG